MTGQVSRDIFDLEQEMMEKAVALLAACAAKGVEMRPFMTLRDVWVQARLWRQSRSRREIDAKIAAFDAGGAPFLAQVIRDVGPRMGRWATNAPPGFSWHQYGLAMDCFWSVDGGAEWSVTRKVKGKNGYHVYAVEAVKLGLDAGGNWTKNKDWVHVQLPPEGSPASRHSLMEIDGLMRRRFGRSGTVLTASLSSPPGFPPGPTADG